MEAPQRSRLHQRSFLLIIFVPATVAFCSPPSALAQDHFGSESESKRGPELYISGFVTRSSPTGSDISFGGDKIPQAQFDASTGGGAKLGLFPKYSSVFGAEVEIVGFGGKITAPQTMQGGTTQSTNQSLRMTNFMLNGIARYPGDFIQPYVGAGLGLSFGKFSGATSSATASVGDEEAFSGFAFQGIAGVRANITKHIFLFTEYKHFIASVDGDRGEEDNRPVHTLDYQSHQVSVGAGLRF